MCIVTCLEEYIVSLETVRGLYLEKVTDPSHEDKLFMTRLCTILDRINTWVTDDDLWKRPDKFDIGMTDIRALSCQVELMCDKEWSKAAIIDLCRCHNAIVDEVDMAKLSRTLLT